MLVKGIINCFFLIPFIISQCICININYFMMTMICRLLLKLFSLSICFNIIYFLSMLVCVHLFVIIFLLMVTKKQIEILLNGFIFRCLLLKGFFHLLSKKDQFSLKLVYHFINCWIFSTSI